MTEGELRALVRQVIAGKAERAPSVALVSTDRLQPFLDAPAAHTSHTLFVLPDGADGDGVCIIEPSVPCAHCGYCRSLGH